MPEHKDGTAGGAVGFFDYLANKSLMNKSTAAARKSAVVKVMEIDDGWEDVDLRSLDLDEQVVRFHNFAKAKYAPNSLSTYESRFRSAVEEYVRYLDDPAAYKPTVRRAVKREKGDNNRASASASGSSTAVGEASAEVTSGPAPAPPPREKLVTYPFPLREGVMAYVQLPTDLRKGEAERMARFLESIAFNSTDAEV
ncbi:hypothetical protein BH20ACT8_BH20ACT8_08840 [soil metagenome]